MLIIFLPNLVSVKNSIENKKTAGAGQGPVLIQKKITVTVEGRTPSLFQSESNYGVKNGIKNKET